MTYHISNLTERSSGSWTVWLMKAAPTVTLESGSKLPRAYCVTRQDFPTPESPAGGGQVVPCDCSSTVKDLCTGCYSFTNSPSSTSLHLGVFWAGSFIPLTSGACGFDSAGGKMLLRPDTPSAAPTPSAHSPGLDPVHPIWKSSKQSSRSNRGGGSSSTCLPARLPQIEKHFGFSQLNETSPAKNWSVTTRARQLQKSSMDQRHIKR